MQPFRSVGFKNTNVGQFVESAAEEIFSWFGRKKRSADRRPAEKRSFFLKKMLGMNRNPM